MNAAVPIEPEVQTFSFAVAEVIRLRLFQQRIAQRRLADLLGLSPAQVSQRFSGRTPFRLDEINLAAGLIGVDAHELIRDAEEFLANDRSPRPATPGGGSMFVLPEFGTASGTRTPNPLIKSQLLCQLS
jgi:transcriptional regulator with XRE-family HTH domain